METTGSHRVQGVGELTFWTEFEAGQIDVRFLDAEPPRDSHTQPDQVSVAPADGLNQRMGACIQLLQPDSIFETVRPNMDAKHTCKSVANYLEDVAFGDRVIYSIKVTEKTENKVVIRYQTSSPRSLVWQARGF